MAGLVVQMSRLPKQTLALLAPVLQTVGDTLAPLSQTCTNVAAWLGKPSLTGKRPITLAGCLWAIFTAGHQVEA